MTRKGKRTGDQGQDPETEEGRDQDPGDDTPAVGLGLGRDTDAAVGAGAVTGGETGAETELERRERGETESGDGERRERGRTDGGGSARGRERGRRRWPGS